MKEKIDGYCTFFFWVSVGVLILTKCFYGDGVVWLYVRPIADLVIFSTLTIQFYLGFK